MKERIFAPKMSFAMYRILVLSLLFAACQGNPPAELPAATQRDTLSHAQNFSIERSPDSLIFLHIGTAWKNAQSSRRYVLYPRHQPAPQTRYPDAVCVPIPIQRYIATGTTQVAMLDFIGVLDKLVAIADDKYVYHEALRQRLASGELPSIGNDGEWDFERGLSARPEVVFAFSIGDNGNILQKWASVGVPVVLLSEFMEETPLGRAEWTRFLAAFFGQSVETATQTRFAAVAQEYEALRASVAERTPRPKVFTGVAYEGSWYVAGGRSFMAQLIRDAGGDYLWADNSETGGLPLDFEAVYAKALRADVWLNVLQTPSLEALRAQDPRYADFQAFQMGRVFGYHRRLSPNGGYDFFESAVVQPQRVLADLAAIFQSEKPNDTLLYYYQALPSK